MQNYVEIFDPSLSPKVISSLQDARVETPDTESLFSFDKFGIVGAGGCLFLIKNDGSGFEIQNSKSEWELKIRLYKKLSNGTILPELFVTHNFSSQECWNCLMPKVMFNEFIPAGSFAFEKWEKKFTDAWYER